MKTLAIVLGISMAAALGAYLHRSMRQRLPTPAQVDSSAATPAASYAPSADTDRTARLAEPPGAAEPAPEPQAMRPTRSALESSDLNRTVDLLVSPLASFAQKHQAWQQVKAAGKLDQVIADLEQRMTSDPRTAVYPAALGQAYLNKCATIQDVREQGILAMQADKVFDTALSLDPANWEARFTKAVAMSYWPPMLNKGEEVIQHFQTLIEQQEAQPPQPQFAETYSWLGDQYQKSGRAEDARAIWQRGAQLFPENANLRKKLGQGQ